MKRLLNWFLTDSVKSFGLRPKRFVDLVAKTHQIITQRFSSVAKNIAVHKDIKIRQGFCSLFEGELFVFALLLHEVMKQNLAFWGLKYLSTLRSLEF